MSELEPPIVDWFLANTLAGVAFAAAASYYAVEPTFWPGMVAAGMAIVFVFLSLRVVPQKVRANV